MDFGFTEEQDMLRQTVREFGEKKLRPRLKEIEERKEIPQDVIKGMADLGLFGINLKSDVGGSEQDLTSAAIVVEELARADFTCATAVYYLVQVGWSMIFDKYGTQQAKAELLPKMIRQENFFGIATTEPEGGSDLAAMRTTISKKGNKWVINGEKAYISGVREAMRLGGGYFGLVKSDPKLGHKGFTCIVLPMGKSVKGLSTTLYEDMGRMGLSTGGFTMKDVEVPDYYAIGQVNNGFYLAMEGFNAARVLVAAACCGAGQGLLDFGIDFIKTRKAFGQPLAKFQGIQFELADNYAQLDAARLVTYRSAWMVDEFYKSKRFTSLQCSKAVAEAKLLAPLIGFKAANDAMSWFGAYGYTKEGLIEAGVRGIRSYSVGAEGATNIMRIIIAREVLGKEFTK
ncbi:MAG: acyl-CoA dehydrogenase family protein [Promethearchaeati archaeon SRVP18_Atabeyarchaeia-1]